MGEWANGRVGVVLVGGWTSVSRSPTPAGNLLCRVADLLVRSHRKASGKTGGSRERLGSRQSYLLSGMARVVDRPIEQNTP